MNDKASNYVSAGFETLSTVLNRFLNKNDDDSFQYNFSKEDLNRFFSCTCNKFLHSYGSEFAKKKNYSKYNEQKSQMIEKCRSYGFYDDSEFFIDSGGFQISVGILNREESLKLNELYYEFVEDYHSVFDRAFILDISPGENCTVFSNFEEIYEENLKSYLKAANLPEEARKKIIYIHHFRTPQLWNIFGRILDENDLYEKFDCFATGGIVANQKSDVDIPCIIYVLPLITLLNRTKKYNRKNLEFHVLGGATFRDILFYKLFTKHVKKCHDIDLNITFDSSIMYKGLMIGRTTYLIHDGIKHLDMRTSELNMKFLNTGKTIEEILFEKMDDMSLRRNIKKLSSRHLYNPDTNTFYRDVRSYLFLYILDFYKLIDDWMEIEADKLYKIFESNDYELFNYELEKITRMTNFGKITKKQQNKTYSMLKSLEMLKDLDEEYCKHLVEKFLSKDEFSFSNTHKQSMLTF